MQKQDNLRLIKSTKEACTINDSLFWAGWTPFRHDLEHTRQDGLFAQPIIDQHKWFILPARRASHNNSGRIVIWILGQALAVCAALA